MRLSADPILKAFGVSVDTRMKAVEGRLLTPPELLYGRQKKVQPQARCSPALRPCAAAAVYPSCVSCCGAQLVPLTTSRLQSLDNHSPITHQSRAGRQVGPARHRPGGPRHGQRLGSGCARGPPRARVRPREDRGRAHARPRARGEPDPGAAAGRERVRAGAGARAQERESA